LIHLFLFKFFDFQRSSGSITEVLSVKSKTDQELYFLQKEGSLKCLCVM